MTSTWPDPTPPALAVQIARGRALEPVWRNQIGGTTWRVGSGDELTYLKVGPLHAVFAPIDDAERYRWLSGWVRVPIPVSVGERGGWGWFETAPVPGRSAVDTSLRAVGGESTVVAALGRALRQFHDSLPVAECPFSWSATDRLALLSPGAASALGQPPGIEADLVVCHGDACNPNFQLHDDLSVAGNVDLARCGLGDRWADLAPAVLSVGWNFGPDLGQHLLRGYGVGDGIAPNDAKLKWYTSLWNAE